LASGFGRFLHDDYSNVSQVQIDLAIHIELADDSRSEYRAGGQRKDLAIVAESLGVWEE
jgi:hypothetical protein